MNKSKIVSILSLFLLTVLIAFSSGWSSKAFNWPISKAIDSYVNEISLFIKGGEGDKDLTLQDRVANDLNLIPTRQMIPATSNDVFGSLEVSSESYTRVIEFQEKKPRRNNPYLLMRSETLFDSGYLFVFGTIDAQAGLHGYWLIDNTGKIVHHLAINDDEARPKNEANLKHIKEWKPQEVRFPHGVALLKDGGLIFNDGDSGNTLRRVDWCGNEQWSYPVSSHHLLNVVDGQLYHIQSRDMIVRNVEDGAITRIIRMNDIMAANSDNGIFNIRFNLLANRALHDPYHQNDVEPLPAKLADKFPQFNAGDLLVSFRSLNLVAVLDRDTLLAKWWAQGYTTRQHDPDWQADGTITIFDNRMVPEGRPSSTKILKINPSDYAHEAIYLGDQHDAYTKIRGTHQILDDQSMLITLPQQGRVILVDENSELAFDFRNSYNQENNLLVSEAKYIPQDHLSTEVLQMQCN